MKQELETVCGNGCQEEYRASPHPQKRSLVGPKFPAVEDPKGENRYESQEPENTKVDKDAQGSVVMNATTYFFQMDRRRSVIQEGTALVRELAETKTS